VQVQLTEREAGSQGYGLGCDALAPKRLVADDRAGRAEPVLPVDQMDVRRSDLAAYLLETRERLEQELEVAGLSRKDRVPKLEESVALMKQLWSGEEVTFDGKYTKLVKGRMGFTPYQKPHPLLEMGAQSEGATKRAARITDGVFFGPQAPWTYVSQLADLYRATRKELGQDLGMLGASRSLMVASSKEEAKKTAAQYLEKTFNMYKTWSMQESNMAELQLSSDIPLEDWAVHGSPADCVETILRAREEMGLNGIGFTIYSLPPSPQARIDYLHMIAEDIVKKVIR
jgi:alkanesulfonate monooxygenase SsuD/methylene tetrahydromethanopterin reductase-like flavin-dependent oxidoreductase (luciferase family)